MLSIGLQQLCTILENIEKEERENISTNTPRVFHVETTWKLPFPRRFNVEYKCCVCKVKALTER